MAHQGRTFVVVGAGIAGLTLALSLAKFGARIVVLERSESLQEFGAGLQISPNARRILNRLAVDRYLKPLAFQPDALDIYPFKRKTPIASMMFGETATNFYGTPYTVMHRADLANSLLQACKRFANIDILFGVRDYDIAQHKNGLTVMVDESDGKSRTIHPFALIGADGVNSRTRTEVLDGPSAQYSGYVAWRTLLPITALEGLIDKQRTNLLCGPGFHAVIYPLHFRNQINVVAFTQTSKKLAFAKSESGAIKIPHKARKSSHFSDILQEAGKTWTKWPMSTVKTTKWHEGSVCLLGDAAHSMLPFQAQGAAMAIEDAAILAPFLMTEKSPSQAFAQYYALRKTRVDKVAAAAKKNGNIFHMSWPLSMARDSVLSRRSPVAHLENLNWIYNYDPSPDPAPQAVSGRTPPQNSDKQERL